MKESDAWLKIAEETAAGREFLCNQIHQSSLESSRRKRAKVRLQLFKPDDECEAVWYNADDTNDREREAHPARGDQQARTLAACFLYWMALDDEIEAAVADYEATAP